MGVRTAFRLVSEVVPDGFDLKGFCGRMCVLNVWRNIDQKAPLLNHHLAMCDGSSATFPDDFVIYDVHQDGADVAETFQVDPSLHFNHRWYYFPQQTSDEALIFMQYDSHPQSTCRYTPHSSLTVNNEFAGFPRESIEV